MEIKKGLTMIIIALLVLFPIALYGQEQGADETNQITGSPPVEQPLVPEGVFAVELAKALKVGQPENEAQAENMLSALGIEPRNGWIADYPVTPDIVGEIEISVAVAAEAKRLEMGKDQALAAVDDLVGRLGLNVFPEAFSQSANQAAPGSPGAETPSSDHYPTDNYGANPPPQVINNYYYNTGPPVITYYPPPGPYYYLYAWVPYPFRCYRFFFPGFFILHDFHRNVIVHKRVFVVTNHVVDARTQRVSVIDPVRRRQFGKSPAFNRATSRAIFDSPSAKASARAIAARSHEGTKSGRIIGRPGPGKAAPPQLRNRPGEPGHPNPHVVTQKTMPSTASRGTARNPAQTGSSAIKRGAPPSPATSEGRNESKWPRSLPGEARTFNNQRISPSQNPATVSGPPVTRGETSRTLGNFATKNGVNFQRPATEGSRPFRPPAASNERLFNSPAIDGRRSSPPAPPTRTMAPRIAPKEFSRPGTIGIRNRMNFGGPRSAAQYGLTGRGNSIRRTC